MGVFWRKALLTFAGTAALGASCLRAADAESVPETYARTHRIFVTIPLERTDVLASSRVDLFASKSPLDGWTVEGACMLVSQPEGMCYQKELTVPYDGVFFFRLGALDEHGNRTPPPDGAPAQSKVVVDSVAPSLVMTTPEEDSSFAPKEPVRISWQVSDPNLAAKPISVAYVFDGDKKQNFIIKNAENVGSVVWNAPDMPNTAVQIAVMAEDRAGNVSLVQRGITIAATNAYRAEAIYTPSKSAQIAFTMAGNLVRRQAPKDALRYYHMAIEHDPNFTDAINDAALVYRHLGDFAKAISLMRRAVDQRPQDPLLYQNMADIEQSWGVELLRGNTLDAGMSHIKDAIKYYGHAIQLSEQQNTVAERAASYFRLGEISYYVNGDPAGARQYWRKVIDLHAPTPDITEPVVSYYRHTTMKTELRTWQMWAREHLRMLDDYEFGEAANHITQPSRSAPRLEAHASDLNEQRSAAENRTMFHSNVITPSDRTQTPVDVNADSNIEASEQPITPQKSRSFLPWRRR